MATVSAFCLWEHVAQAEATWSYQREKALLRDCPVMAAQLMLRHLVKGEHPMVQGAPAAAGPLWARPRSPGAEHMGVCLPRAHFLSLVQTIRMVMYRRAPDHGEAVLKAGNHAAFVAAPRRLSCALLSKQTTLNPQEWRQQHFSLTPVTPSWLRLCPTQSFSQDLGWRSRHDADILREGKKVTGPMTAFQASSVAAPPWKEVRGRDGPQGDGKPVGGAGTVLNSNVTRHNLWERCAIDAIQKER